MYKPALRQAKETRPLVGKERFGSWMIVKRKPRRPPRKPDGRGDQMTLPPYTKPVRTSETKVYNNQLYNSRFGPLEDLDAEELDSPQAQTPREATKNVIPRLLEAIVNQPNKNQQMRVPAGSQGNYRGRGGRTNTPRRAAAEEEHTVVRGSLRGKVVSKEVVQHQLRPPDLTPSHSRKPSRLNGPTEEGAYFFDCFSPRDAMEEDGRDVPPATNAVDLHRLD